MNGKNPRVGESKCIKKSLVCKEATETQRANDDTSKSFAVTESKVASENVVDSEMPGSKQSIATVQKSNAISPEQDSNHNLYRIIQLVNNSMKLQGANMALPNIIVKNAQSNNGGVFYGLPVVTQPSMTSTNQVGTLKKDNLTVSFSKNFIKKF